MLYTYALQENRGRSGGCTSGSAQYYSYAVLYSSMQPEEDRQLCVHKYTFLAQASGFARSTPDKYVLFFYCEKCVNTRKKIIDVSDQHIDRQTVEEYESDDGVGAA